MINGRFKHWMFEHSLGILVVLLVLGVVLFAGLVALGIESTELIVGYFGGVVAYFYFIHKQSLEEVRLFNELFRECNARYDKLNGELNRIAHEPKPLSPADIDLLYDYFNLCAEEYLYYRRGYIYPEVWAAWCNGIGYFLKSKSIKPIWQREEGTGSYYGLSLAQIERDAGLAQTSRGRGVPVEPIRD